jgi:hypothetical protein
MQRKKPIISRVLKRTRNAGSIYYGCQNKPHECERAQAMFGTNIYLNPSATIQSAENHYGRSSWALAMAVRMYREVSFQAKINQALSRFTGRSKKLVDLDSIKGSEKVMSGHFIGLQTVPISRILGSESRSTDFDADFRPLRKHDRSRWIGVAQAHLSGTVFSPIELIQVGSQYFVRDGHHRLSVMKALGQRDIEAEITVLKGFDRKDLPRPAKVLKSVNPHLVSS